MIQFFLSLYRFFAKHKIVLYGLMLILFAGAAYFAPRIRLVEDIASFMPETDDSKMIGEVFKSMKIKDEIVLLISSGDTTRTPNPERLIEVCDAFTASLQASETGKTHIKRIRAKVDEDMIGAGSRYVTEHLPVFLEDSDYTYLDGLLSESGKLENRIEQNYINLLSPLSIISQKNIVSDPLGLSGKYLKNLDDLHLNLKYDIYDEHLFSTDRRYLTAFITPTFNAGEISENEVFVDEIESQINRFAQQYPDVSISYFGGIPVSVYNARQIKSDAFFTMLAALSLISLVVVLAFKRKSAIPLIALPVLFGGAFSLAIIYLMQGSVSTIAVGAGSIVLGVALSYSMHVFHHSMHSQSPEQVIRELAYPMTIGSFTTIGGFVGLTFCNSDVLNDLGLFAAFTLIGTTLFSLVFLPHLIVFKPAETTWLMRKIEKINSYSYEKNKILIVSLALITVVCLFFFNDVKFNGDMMQLNYMSKRFSDAEKTLNDTFQDEYKSVYFVSTGDNVEDVLKNYDSAGAVLSELKAAGMIKEFSSGGKLLISPREQQRRIDVWNRYWTPDKKQKLKDELIKAGEKYHFTKSAFDEFFGLLDKNQTVIDYTSPDFEHNPLLRDMLDCSGRLKMAVTQVRLSEQNKKSVYDEFSRASDIVIMDKPYFANKMAEAVNNDFNRILYIVSILVFVSILLSYGRIEITLLTFLPMAVSWVIILGLMALLGIQFNIISIIISTFIFGIGDDFSIFVTDGLLTEYRDGRKMLNVHKTSGFFSMFTVIVGLGAMLFSKHPALYSVSVTSVIGMLVVLLVAYTIQPFIFRLLISDRTSCGKFPHTCLSLFVTSVALTVFTLGSILLTSLSFLLPIMPGTKKRKQLVFHKMIHYFSRFLLWLMYNKKRVYQNPTNENFSKPAIVIANHQSVVDILQMAALHDKMMMVTKTWVMNSFLFGRVAAYAGFIDVSYGYENAEEQIAEKLNEGWSIGIFPEGSRSKDCVLKRFHKGAFYLSDKTEADIVPVLFHGNGQAMSKDDPFYLKNTSISVKILKRISYPERSKFGKTYQETTKEISGLFKKEHARFVREIDTTINPYFRYRLMKSYVYKGPVLEWYLRIKNAMEKDYLPFEKLVPETAKITDIGCGYGFLCYMLAFRSPTRTIIGIDYDDEKITVANHAFSKTDRMYFVAADASEYSFENSDVFILNDVLHYLPKEKQDKILLQCVEKLNENGAIIIRDGDREKAKRHTFTRISEFFSTKVVKFNKKEHELCFLSTEEIKRFASENNLSVVDAENDRYSSNTVYVLKKQLG